CARGRNRDAMIDLPWGDYYFDYW
nr:immunoglobulin heavy chain junction region [Macaca mulatta]MOV56685.1 immunoglobulin heavy chain junction region [Macaca mulatta]MOV56849.1 immunoglobulin heavy chain junction region [Macaca mulatta]MOV56924.1 immunoglobulin heavy chain junction region [Macaca mulatta]MOV58480.1 immunoglobulin heavy chain junction region [Macaca mulatta]